MPLLLHAADGFVEAEPSNKEMERTKGACARMEAPFAAHLQCWAYLEVDERLA
jgi:hypothetical protein